MSLDRIFSKHREMNVDIITHAVIRREGVGVRISSQADGETIMLLSVWDLILYCEECMQWLKKGCV